MYAAYLRGLAFLSSFSWRYSDAAMDREAATPTMRPVAAISFGDCNANVRPKRAPVISTIASFRPRTIEPAYFFFDFFERGFFIGYFGKVNI